VSREAAAVGSAMIQGGVRASGLPGSCNYLVSFCGRDLKRRYRGVESQLVLDCSFMVARGVGGGEPNFCGFVTKLDNNGLFRMR
jgi:hypothetical protein